MDASARHDRKLQQLREQAEVRFRSSEARFRSSAARLQATGASAEARRAEQFAEWARLDRAEPRAARLLYDALRESRAVGALDALLDEVLGFALELLHADRGNVQLADPATGALRIAAHQGFGPEFLEYFAVVTDDGSACGRAARSNAQVVIADVATDPRFAPHCDIAAASGFRAVQSTPLTTLDGRLVGMLSTHYSRPGIMPVNELRIIRRFGALIGERLTAPPSLERAPRQGGVRPTRHGGL